MFACHSTCTITAKNQLVSLKLVVMIGCNCRKNLLTFGGDPFPDRESGLFFHFPHHCRLRHFCEIYCHIFLYSHWPLSLGEMTYADKGMNPLHVGSDPAQTRIRARINPEFGIRIPDHFCLHFGKIIGTSC